MISQIIGKVITNINRSDEELVFHCSDGEIFKMFHERDCCESVLIEDITGDLDDLIGTPILKATEDCSNDDNIPVNVIDKLPDTHVASLVAKKIIGESQDAESQTWTFYNLATIKGYVTIRWYGTSNGYYSESVSFLKM